jgi:hypothetical protein cdiviTM7_02475
MSASDADDDYIDDDYIDADDDDRIAELEFKTDTLWLLVALMLVSDLLGSTSSVNIFSKAFPVVLFIAQFGLYCYTYIPKVYSYLPESLRRND